MCEGTLRTTGPELAIEYHSGLMPEPQGGVIPDGIYDLILRRKYLQADNGGIEDTYPRSALRFYDGATRVEHFHDLENDSAIVHRQLSVTNEGSVLHFTVTCPAQVLDQNYDRAYSVLDAELWLFQHSTLEKYARRP